MLFAEETLYTVTQLNTLVKDVVEGNFPDVAVLGEVSNFKHHSSGHLYFTLKDADAQLRAVCFRSSAGKLGVDVKNGMKVVARGRLTVYEAYGQYQVVAYDIKEAGEGELERAFRALKKKLEEEGLFDEARKRKVAPYPARIAVITSPTGAAIRDILSTLERRWPCAEVFLFPVHVQGDAAVGEIVRAMEWLPRIEGGVDLAIVGRGGGSLEDLWAFNEEKVARAISGCPVPVISAVGHETDFTIADFVADVRAATPTMAAQIAVPDRDELVYALSGKIESMTRYILSEIRLRSAKVRELMRSYALGRVRNRIESAMQSLDYLIARLGQSASGMLKDRRGALENVVAKLSAMNPREILERGYTICSDSSTGAVLKRADEAMAAKTVVVTFCDGAVRSEIKEKCDVR